MYAGKLIQTATENIPTQKNTKTFPENALRNFLEQCFGWKSELPDLLLCDKQLDAGVPVPTELDNGSQ